MDAAPGLDVVSGDPRTSMPAPAHLDERTPRARALALLLVSALLWSAGGLLIKSVDWSAPAISAVRSLIAAGTIALWYRGALRFTWSRWQIAAAVAYAATTLLFVLANKLTTAANAILLQYTAPVFIALASPWVLGERIRGSDWMVIVLTLGGMTLFFRDSLSPEGLAGNLVAIASGVTFAALAICMRKQKDGSPVESIVLGNLLGAALALPFVRGPVPGTESWLMLLALGVFQLGLSYIAYSAAMKHATAIDAGLVPMLEPILNPIWVVLFHGERPGPNALLGGAVVFGAVGLRTVLSLRRDRDAPAPPPSPD